MSRDYSIEKSKIELPIFVGTVFVTVLLRTLALFFDRKENGYFDAKILTGISSGLLIVFCLFALLSGGRHRFERKRPADAHSPLVYLPSAFAALTVLLFLYRFYPKLEAFQNARILHGASVLALGFGIPAFLYLFLRVFIEAPLSSVRALFGLGASLFMGLLAICLYFETSLPLNHPAKLTDQVAFLVAALYFLAESRASLGRDKVGLRSAVTMMTAVFSAYASLPILFYQAVRGQCLSVDLFCELLLLGVFTLSLGSLLLSQNRRSAAKHPYIAALTESFEERERALAVRETAEEPAETSDEEEPSANQLSMDELLEETPSESETPGAPDQTDGQGEENA